MARLPSRPRDRRLTLPTEPGAPIPELAVGLATGCQGAGRKTCTYGKAPGVSPGWRDVNQLSGAFLLPRLLARGLLEAIATSPTVAAGFLPAVGLSTGCQGARRKTCTYVEAAGRAPWVARRRARGERNPRADPHIPACPKVFRSEVIAISPNCRGGTRHSAGLKSSTATAPA